MLIKLRLIACVCFFITLSAVAKNRQVPIYNNVPLYGIDLTEGWHYIADDKAEFAKPNFPDTLWPAINPSLMLYEIPQLKNVKTGWLRMHFKVGSQLGGKALLISLVQNCASEIYLDGKLIKRYGVISADPAKVVPIGINLPVEEIHLKPFKEHVFAVRFSPWDKGFYIKDSGYFFYLTMTDLANFQKTDDMIKTGNQTYVILVAVFFLLSLLHLSFYKYNPAQKANLYFALYTIVSTIAFLLVCFQDTFQDMRYYAIVRTPAYLAALMTGIWSIRALSSLFNYRTKRLMVALWVTYFLSVLAIILYGIIIPYYTILILFEGVHIWLLGKALLEKKRGAGIIALGFAVSLLAALFTTVEQIFQLNLDIVVAQSVVGITYLAPAFGISLYLAREFALNSNLLREKLVEVEQLSAQAIAYEQEKQQILSKQKDELELQVTDRTSALQASLQELRTTQAQLIQSEKMASLGELTAGIAHEIQNPLNFVNNFSEVSSELLDELKQELATGSVDEANAIADDLMHNLEKIHHHGKRADNIVKGMLEHSRSSSGKKTPVDINKLVDEYLKLAYHGLRAKDKTFNAKLVTQFKAELPLVNVIPQDIGRVMLNMFNNAFYAVQQQTMDGYYEPVIEVITDSVEHFILITIKDNGIGITAANINKIMQPFFTTKPTGEGTGLGLSLSYDIVVKGHNGRVEVSSEVGKGSVFKVSLPV